MHCRMPLASKLRTADNTTWPWWWWWWSCFNLWVYLILNLLQSYVDSVMWHIWYWQICSWMPSILIVVNFKLISRTDIVVNFRHCTRLTVSVRLIIGMNNIITPTIYLSDESWTKKLMTSASFLISINYQIFFNTAAIISIRFTSKSHQRQRKFQPLISIK